MRFKFYLLCSAISLLCVQSAVGQATYPSPYLLSLGTYGFTQWLPASPPGTYPPNMVIHRSNNQDPGLANFVAANDYTLAYNLSTGTRVNGENLQGLSFFNTGTSGQLGALVLALNTSGQVNITVGFVAETLVPGTGDSPREYRLRLQYRVGDTGAFLDLPGTPEYSSSTGSEQTFSGIVLPDVCEDQPLVHLRWLYYQHAANGGGGRPRIRIDDISVSGESGACVAPTSGATNLTASNLGATTATLTWQNGSGAGRLVVLSANAPVSDIPSNGVTYTANPAFGTSGTELGNGYVVYTGSGSSVNVTGLTAGVTYYAEVYEYKCASPQYLTTQVTTTAFSPIASPEIVVTPSTPIVFNTIPATPSTPVQVNVSGVFLNNEIDISVTGEFQISFESAANYSTGLSLTPTGGSVTSTTVFVRFNPPANAPDNGVLTFSSPGAATVNIALSGQVDVTELLAEPFNLCQGAYHFDEWPASAPAGTYPPSMVFKRYASNDPGIAVAMLENYTDGYGLTSGSRINGLGSDGIAFLNTGTLGNLGSAVLALNTLGRVNITVSYLASLLAQAGGTPVPRNYGLRCQYRVGGGAWMDFASPVDYPTVNLSTGDVQQFTGIVLPAECENQPIVYLRWFYYQIAVNNGGSRPRVRLDNITVDSQALNPALSDAVSEPGSEPAFISSLVTGSIDTDADGAQAWAFTLRDGGAGGDPDALPTLVHEIVIGRGALDNTPSWTSHLAAAALFEGANKLADGTITPNSIIFNDLNLTIADNQSRTFSLRIALTDDGSLADNTHFHFRLGNASLTTDLDCSSSQFEPFEIESDPLQNRIDVEATEMHYVAFVTQAMVDVPFAVTVVVTDQNGSVDRDDRDVTLAFATSGGGTLTAPDGLGPFAMNQGSYTWTGVSASLIGVYTLTAFSDDPVVLEVENDVEIIPNIGVSEESRLRFNAYPNPNRGDVLWFNSWTSGSLMDMAGRVILRFGLTNQISLSGLNPGVYVLSSSNGTAKIIVE